MIAGASLWFVVQEAWVVIVADLKNMDDRQEWKGQRFKKIYIRKITQHEEMFLKLSFEGVIRFDSNMEHDEVYGKFVLTVCICSVLYFAKKIDSASLFTRGIIIKEYYIKLF